MKLLISRLAPVELSVLGHMADPLRFRMGVKGLEEAQEDPLCLLRPGGFLLRPRRGRCRSTLIVSGP